MHLGFKSIGVVLIAIVCAQPATANETVDFRELAQVMGQALVTGYVDAEIHRSCLIQITADNSKYVANEAECLESLSGLQRVLLEDEGLADQVSQVKRFRTLYSI